MNLTPQSQKIIGAALVSVTVVAALQGLIVILNLNQVQIFLKVSVLLYVYLLAAITILYDLHFKRVKVKNFGQALEHEAEEIISRFAHLRQWRALRHWLNYIIVPTFLFWSTVVLLYLNFGYLKIQQIFFVLSSTAFIINYWYLKEVFKRHTERVENDIFVALSTVKIYTIAITFGAGLGFLRSFCVPGILFAGIAACVTFLFIHQALFQHNRTGVNTMLITLAISLLMGTAGFFVYVYWGLNYYTAAVFLAALYNFFWGTFHYRLDHSLTWHAFIEISVVMLLIAAMVFSVTNFKARLLGGCLQQNINFNL